MKYQAKNQYTSLSSKELTTINGGSIMTEDYICPELQELFDALNNIRFIINR